MQCYPVRIIVFPGGSSGAERCSGDSQFGASGGPPPKGEVLEAAAKSTAMALLAAPLVRVDPPAPVLLLRPAHQAAAPLGLMAGVSLDWEGAHDLPMWRLLLIKAASGAAYCLQTSPTSEQTAL